MQLQFSIFSNYLLMQLQIQNFPGLFSYAATVFLFPELILHDRRPDREFEPLQYCCLQSLTRVN